MACQYHCSCKYEEMAYTGTMKRMRIMLKSTRLESRMGLTKIRPDDRILTIVVHEVGYSVEHASK